MQTPEHVSLFLLAIMVQSHVEALLLMVHTFSIKATISGRKFPKANNVVPVLVLITVYCYWNIELLKPFWFYRYVCQWVLCGIIKCCLRRNYRYVMYAFSLQVRRFLWGILFFAPHSFYVSHFAVILQEKLKVCLRKLLMEDYVSGL